MSVVGLSSERQKNVLGVISAILHLGNIQFVEDNNVAEVENPTGRRPCMFLLLSWGEPSFLSRVKRCKGRFIHLQFQFAAI